MGLFEASKEKQLDVRVLERSRGMGKIDKKALEASQKALPDSSEIAVYTNLDELNAKDNPVHMARNLPSLEAAATKNIEDLEFDSDEANRGFEQ